MRNIGPVSRRWLLEAGIRSVDDLARCGVVETYRLIKGRHKGASLNLLWALEGAVQDMDWRDLPKERKERLKRELR